ncbi:hypothetical protein E4634_00580 [Mangrovimicrobium sediminis]|uniref:Uncharacterized protein n=1 Tax=Mangrovimicrobium sediminis TaxID=2562682 RepID=A0A4Z0M9J9_9GAMM|nr:hypothetical protein [Haliea sp. SAOS-164]TGD76080.1 hypothetical protein E4634_00580 [Haliea sp. SAOS-164]
MKANFESQLLGGGSRYSLQEGEWIAVDFAECFIQQSFCYGNNPLTTYSYASFPWRFPESFRYASTFIDSFMLGDDEAVVVLMQTPPEMAYLGVTPYVHNRRNPVTQGRGLVAASYSDTVNHLRMGAFLADPNEPVDPNDALDPNDPLDPNAPGTGSGYGVAALAPATPSPAQLSGAAAGSFPFDRLTAFIMTGNREVADTLTAVLDASGLPASAVNVLPIPVGAPELPLFTGYRFESDEFSLIGRFTFPDDPVAQQNWNAAKPVAVYRIGDDAAASATYPLENYAPRQTGVSEYVLLPGIEQRLDDLVSALRLRHPEATANVFYDGKVGAGRGWDCIAGYLRCAFDNQDALYIQQITDPEFLRLRSDPGNFWYVVGVNHRRTGKARYTNHSVYYRRLAGGVSSIDDSTAAGSAAYYAEAYSAGLAIGDFEDFYVFRIARDCDVDELALGYCMEVPYPTGQDPIGVDDNDSLYLVSRSYLEEISGVGPDISEVVPPVVMVYR